MIAHLISVQFIRSISSTTYIVLGHFSFTNRSLSHFFVHHSVSGISFLLSFSPPHPNHSSSLLIHLIVAASHHRIRRHQYHHQSHGRTFTRSSNVPVRRIVFTRCFFYSHESRLSPQTNNDNCREFLRFLQRVFVNVFELFRLSKWHSVLWKLELWGYQALKEHVTPWTFFRIFISS